MSELASSALDAYKLWSLPDKGFYVPDFIAQEQEAHILGEIEKLPSTKWTTLTHRRLLSLPSQLTGTARDTLLAASMPAFLIKTILDKFKDLGVFEGSPHGAPNHCLVNEYQPKQGIMPHTDGSAYYPVIATVSLASHTVLNIYEKNEQGERETKPTWRILQEPRSLLVTSGNMYKDTLHGITEVEEDTGLGPGSIANWDLLGDKQAYQDGTARRETRISLTYRDVLKVSKLGGAMSFMGKR